MSADDPAHDARARQLPGFTDAATGHAVQRSVRDRPAMQE
jgi:hypothetical protein